MKICEKRFNDNCFVFLFKLSVNEMQLESQAFRSFLNTTHLSQFSGLEFPALSSNRDLQCTRPVDCGRSSARIHSWLGADWLRCCSGWETTTRGGGGSYSSQRQTWLRLSLPWLHQLQLHWTGHQSRICKLAFFAQKSYIKCVNIRTFQRTTQESASSSTYHDAISLYSRKFN